MGGQKLAQGFLGVLAADAGEEDGNAGLRRGRLARRDFPKRRGFLFQREANENEHRGFIAAEDKKYGQEMP